MWPSLWCVVSHHTCCAKRNTHSIHTAGSPGRLGSALHDHPQGGTHVGLVYQGRLAPHNSDRTNPRSHHCMCVT